MGVAEDGAIGHVVRVSDGGATVVRRQRNERLGSGRWRRPGTQHVRHRVLRHEVTAVVKFEPLLGNRFDRFVI